MLIWINLTSEPVSIVFYLLFLSLIPNSRKPSRKLLRKSRPVDWSLTKMFCDNKCNCNYFNLTTQSICKYQYKRMHTGIPSCTLDLHNPIHTLQEGVQQLHTHTKRYTYSTWLTHHQSYLMIYRHTPQPSHWLKPTVVLITSLKKGSWLPLTCFLFKYQKSDVWQC